MLLNLLYGKHCCIEVSLPIGVVRNAYGPPSKAYHHPRDHLISCEPFRISQFFTWVFIFNAHFGPHDIPNSKHSCKGYSGSDIS